MSACMLYVLNVDHFVIIYLLKLSVVFITLGVNSYIHV